MIFEIPKNEIPKNGFLKFREMFEIHVNPKGYGLAQQIHGECLKFAGGLRFCCCLMSSDWSASTDTARRIPRKKGTAALAEGS